jgi:hypothetical protein
MENTKHIFTPLPNGIDLIRLAKLLSFSDTYEITIQFWPQLIAVYISKNGVELKDFGGDFDFAIDKAIEYLVRIAQRNSQMITPILPTMRKVNDISEVSYDDLLFYELGHYSNLYSNRVWIREGQFQQIENVEEFIKKDKRLLEKEFLDHHNFMVIKN